MEHSLLLQLSSADLVDDKTSQLRHEYQVVQRLFERQSGLAKQFLMAQGASIAEAIEHGSTRVQFTLPDVISFGMIQNERLQDEIVPPGNRHQVVKPGLLHLSQPDMRAALCQRLAELERSTNRALLVSAELLRYAIADYMVYSMLPAGRSVVYKAVDADDIPNQPEVRAADPGNWKKSFADRRTEANQDESGQAEVIVPYVEAARGFYLPQWVAFDERGNLLLGSVAEAEAHIASMEHYLGILKSAEYIAPYMIADEVFQQKRYGMLGQLVNQGRALANYQTKEIIRTIQRRVAGHMLDRGLRLSLPYFNDQTLEMEMCHFDVIPAGRIMFVPAFVVLAVREQAAIVAQDIRFDKSTRRHLLMQLSELEQAFLR
jgi:hypothetical protein